MKRALSLRLSFLAVALLLTLLSSVQTGQAALCLCKTDADCRHGGCQDAICVKQPGQICGACLC